MTALSTREFAERCGIAQATVCHLIRSGKLRAQVVNPDSRRPTYRITEAAARAYEQRCTR